MAYFCRVILDKMMHHDVWSNSGGINYAGWVKIDKYKIHLANYMEL